MKILFTGARHNLALDLVRNFGRHGHTVYIAESLHTTMAGDSKYTYKKYYMPSVRFDEDAYFKKLIEIINDEQIDVLFPILEDIFYVAKNKERILEAVPNVKILTDDLDKLVQLHDKYSFYKIVFELGIPTPRTALIQDKAQIAQFIKETEQGNGVSRKQNDSHPRYILKPVFSLFGTEQIRLDENPNLEEIDLKDKTWLMQEFIDGPLVCSYAYVENGKIKFHSVYDNGGFVTKTGYGAVTYYTPVKDCEEIVDIMAKIAKKLDFNGHLSFDFINHKGTYYILECNPRITGGASILRKNDFYQLYFGEIEPNEIRRNKGQTAIINLMSFADYSPAFLKRLLTYPDLIGNIRDMKPFASSFKQLKEFGAQSEKYGCTFNEAFYYDLQYQEDEE